MGWVKKSRNSWKLEKPSIDGEASLKQDEGGYKILLKVTDKEFGMVLRDFEEFFESRKKGIEKLKEEMEEFAG